MTNSPHSTGIVAARLSDAALAENFADIAPKLATHEARVAADRCYFCHDAPCITACPTSIDIPLFIRQIATGTPEAAAKTIFAQNIMGGMCARVCPTEQLCEEVCVREIAEGKPVEIGRLQRFATDTLMDKDIHPFRAAPATGRKMAVVGAGPAGLACAHRLALYGHSVTVFDRRAKAGGLNEYGIATYKTVENFAAREVDWLLKIGGISLQHGVELGKDITLDQLEASYDAVFLGIGLGDVNRLDIPGENLAGVEGAVDFIAKLRQSPPRTVAIGRDVVVIGGGMTAVDAAVQSKLLGAQSVTMVYRRGKDRMSASEHEQAHAASAGVRLIYGAEPVEIQGKGAVERVIFTYDGDHEFSLDADQVFKAIGQKLDMAPIAKQGNKLVGQSGKIWTGGDCAHGGADLTVTAVAMGRDAAEAIHAKVMG